MQPAAMNRRKGVLVRTTIHEKARPMVTAKAVPPAQAQSELRMAAWTLGFSSTVMKLCPEGRKALRTSTTGLMFESAPISSTNIG
jgi:hypothetical protein